MNARTFALFKRSLIAVFAFGFFAFTLSIVYDGISQNNDVRTKAAGSKIGRDAVCKGKEMCSDGKCIGETWRECLPCPVGKARSVYRAACDDDIYSDCSLPGDICDDK